MLLYLDAGNILSYPTTGTAWSDLSGNSRTGTLTNGPTYSGTNGGSIVFDGVNDYVQTPSLSLTGNETNLTLSCWFKPANTNTTRAVISIGDETIGGRRMILQRNGLIEANGSYRDFSSSNSVLSTNTWCNIAIVYTSFTIASGIALYFNGIAISGAPFPSNTGTTLNAFTSTTCTIAGVNATVPTEQVAGGISQVSIYNRALSAAEVLQNYNALRWRYGV
jgi:hypothetical protein